MTGSAPLLRDFVNTYDVEADTDEFGAPSDLGAWLAERDLVTAGTRTQDTDLAAAVTLREALRAAMLAHHSPGTPPEHAAELESVLADLPLRLSLDGPALVPVRDGAPAGLARVAAAVIGAVADGTWPRLKVCQEPRCRWAFLDTSKNRSRTWCSMRVCGNRTKTRAYRARRG